MLVAPLYQWETLKTNLVWAYRGPVRPKFRRVQVGMGYVAVWRLIHGEVTLSWAGNELRCAPGDWVVVPPGKIWQHFSNDAEIWSVRFVLSTSTNECLLAVNHPLPLFKVDREMTVAAKRLIDLVQGRYGQRQADLLRMKSTLAEYLEMETLFREFLQELLRMFEIEDVPLRVQGTMDPRLQHCVWEVRNAPLSQPHSEADLAKMAGVSISQLNRLFHAHFGQTSRAWLDNYRYGEAQRLLDSPRPIKEVSFALGFSSPQHFASWFRKRTGHTPTQWRKIAAEAHEVKA